MEELLTYRQELLSALESDVTLVAKFEASVSKQEWFRPLGEYQITHHFLLTRLWFDDAHGYVPQVHRIMEEEMAVLSDFDADAWTVDHYDPEEPARVMIENFASLRTWEVGFLCGLRPADWSRTGRHPRWGVHTLQWWVEQQRESSQQQLGRLTPLLNL
jgi:hypothetical protein